MSRRAMIQANAATEFEKTEARLREERKQAAINALRMLTESDRSEILAMFRTKLKAAK